MKNFEQFKIKSEQLRKIQGGEGRPVVEPIDTSGLIRPIADVGNDDWIDELEIILP